MPPLLHLGYPGTMGHPGAQERTLRGPGLDFLDFSKVLDPILRIFWETIDQKKEYVVMFVPRFFFLVIFGSESGCRGVGDWKIRHLA